MDSKSKKNTGLPAYEIIYDHPTSIGNEILSDCIIERLSSDMFLQKNVT